MIEYKKTLSVKYDWRSFNANHIAQDIIMNKPNYMLRHAFGEKMLEECQCDYEVPVGLFWSPTVQRQTEHVPYEEVDAWINAQQPKRWKTNYRLSDFLLTGELKWASHIQRRMVYGYTTDPDGVINEMLDPTRKWTQIDLYYLGFKPEDWLAYQICK